MKTIVREIQGEEMLNVLYSLNSYSLHPSPPLFKKEEWTSLVGSRKGVTCFALFEDDEPVSIAASTSMTQNMRGMQYSASGVWGVSTKPQARRNNYCKQVMAELLAAARNSGQVFSNLYPFRESFYERLGYIAFPLVRIAKFTTAELGPILQLGPQGRIDQQLIGPAYPTYREYLATMQLKQHGMACFEHGDQVAADRNSVWIAFAKFDKKVEGLLLYRLQGEEVTRNTLVAHRFYYTTSRARYLMLNWIARHVDQAEKVELWLSPDESPETWWSDLSLKYEAPVRPAMTRVLDVAELTGMEVGKGLFTAKISDPICPWNNGVWEFKSKNDRLVVSPITSAECDLSIQGLTALISGTINPADLPFRGWGNPDVKTQEQMKGLFVRMIPYMHENF